MRKKSKPSSATQSILSEPPSKLAVSTGRSSAGTRCVGREELRRVLTGQEQLATTELAAQVGSSSSGPQAGERLRRVALSRWALERAPLVPLPTDRLSRISGLGACRRYAALGISRDLERGRKKKGKNKPMSAYRERQEKVGWTR
jgi:hypothetical protein